MSAILLRLVVEGNMKSVFKHILTGLVVAGTAVGLVPLRAADKSARLSFVAVGTNEFGFDTGVLQGTVRSKGKSAGLSSVVYLPTGLRLDSSLGLFSHYRVFTTNHRFGTAAWDWPSEASVESDGSLLVLWPSTADRPFELAAKYSWASPGSLDLETSVRALGALDKFEVFLASYFTDSFTNALVCAGPKHEWIATTVDKGLWQTYLGRDDALPIFRDGRWKLEPYPVDWTCAGKLQAHVAVRRAPAANLTVGLMARPADCFAISLPHQSEAHFSTYLSLFGRDLKAGESASARTRLVVIPTADEGSLLKSYEGFLKETAPK